MLRTRLGTVQGRGGREVREGWTGDGKMGRGTVEPWEGSFDCLTILKAGCLERVTDTGEASNWSF